MKSFESASQERPSNERDREVREKKENLRKLIFAAFRNDPRILHEIAADDITQFTKVSRAGGVQHFNEGHHEEWDEKDREKWLERVEKDALENSFEFEMLLRQVQPDVLERMAKALDGDTIFITATKARPKYFEQRGLQEENIRLWITPPTAESRPDWGTNPGGGVMESTYAMSEALGNRKPGDRIIRHLSDPTELGTWDLEDTKVIGGREDYVLYTLTRKERE